MKKIYLFALIVLTACFTACTDDDYNEGVAPPQSHPQEEVQTTDGFTFALGSNFSEGITITDEDLIEGAVSVYEAIKTTATPKLSEGAVVEFKLEVSDTEDFAKKAELACSNDAGTATVLATDLDAAMKDIYGKGKVPRTFYLRAYYYVVDGESSVLMPNPVVLGPFTVTSVAGPDLLPYYEVSPKPYFIIGYGGWDNSYGGLGSSLVPLGLIAGDNYNEEGAGTFVYTGYFEASKDFKLVGAIGDWNEQWGSTDGGLTPVRNDGGSKNFKVPADGYYTITLNSIDHVLKIESASVTPTLYSTIGLIGDINGWGGDVVMNPYQSVDNHIWYTTYTFDADAGDGIKLRANGGWDTSWGGDYFPSAIGTSDNGANIKYTAGTYTVIFDDISGVYYFFQP